MLKPIIGNSTSSWIETAGKNLADNDFAYLKEVLALSDAPVIAEGKVDTPAKAKRCLELGCHAVVVGGAITLIGQLHIF